MQTLNTRIARFYGRLSNIVSKHILVLLFIIFSISVCLRSAFIVGAEFFTTILLGYTGFALADIAASHRRTRIELKAWRLIATTASGNPARTHAIDYLKRNGVNVDGVDVTATNSVSETDKK